jgi:hypothetical protein
VRTKEIADANVDDPGSNGVSLISINRNVRRNLADCFLRQGNTRLAGMGMRLRRHGFPPSHRDG